MALRAADHAVQPEQRVIAQVVIEQQVGAPGILAVAGIAVALDFAAVRVLAAMAADAILGELLIGDRGRVAGVTIDLRMCAHQRKLVPSGMVVGLGELPMLVVVAIAAFGAEAIGMGIVGAVAAVAVLRDLILVVPAAVAGQAVDMGVCAQELIAGLLQMIVLGGLPFLGHVALAALLASRSTVLIVGGVTAGAGPRRRLVAARDVTRIAGERGVGSCQLELGLVMIELAAGPAHGAVALAARFGELPVVHVVRLVTADAGRRRLAPCLSRLVAAGALERRMRAFQREVGQVMVEARGIELHDIGCAALVLRVAGAAFADAGSCAIRP